MRYICHKKYKKTGASGIKYDIPRGKELDTIGHFIAKDNSAVCAITSDDAYRYFARNDDGNGIERGKITSEIAHSGTRFTDEEIEMLEADYAKFLSDADAIIFNYDFFNADMEELRGLRDRLCYQ